ncbi:MAG: aldehyde dehydrogenase family protein [Chloroflexi bacterium]|nr:MAG: aldehyde dehydrogenase family protein [Chloroflexota bacterium]
MDSDASAVQARPRERTPNTSAGTPGSVPAEWSPWIGGRETRTDVEYDPVINPATGAVLCRVARCGTAEIDFAARAADAALAGWAGMPTAERGRMLMRVARHVRECETELALLETLNNGKPLREARDDVVKSAEAFEFYAGLSDKLFGSTIPISPQYLSYTLREPLGVTAHIAPWNYPLRLAVRSVAPALAAGNTVVLKPAEETPLTALRLARVLAEAGLPDGVFNVVPGSGSDAGAALVDHPLIRHISLTGSVETGVRVMQRAARRVVPLTLELGGKSPNIVLADADLDLALEGTIKAIFTNAGQVCCAGSRLLLEDSIYQEFLDRLIERARQLRVGPGLEDPDMGPLISEAHRHRVLSYVALGQQEGATLLLGGKPPDDPGCQYGYFLEPTLLAGMSNATRVAQEEIFGPVLTIFRFRTEMEAIQLANDSPYGLVAGVWTADLNRAHGFAARLQAGQVYINDFFSGSVASPFGGYKQSGFGRERGVEALDHYTQVKSVCVRLGH